MLAATATCQVAHAFDGKVEMSVTTSDGKMPMTYFIKGTRMRTEVLIKSDEEKPRKSKKKRDKAEQAPKAEAAPTMRAVSIINAETLEVIAYTENLAPDTTRKEEGEDAPPKFYMKMKLPAPGEAKGAGKDAAEAVFTPTGRSETIAGYKAEEYVSVSKKGERTEMWVTKELGRFIMANQGKGAKGAKAKGWEQFAQSENVFPLRVVQRAKEGEPEVYRMEVVSIDKAPLQDSLFLPPEGYQPMPSFGEMMKGAIPGFGK